jgi:hypothetical protein
MLREPFYNLSSLSVLFGNLLKINKLYYRFSLTVKKCTPTAAGPICVDVFSASSENREWVTSSKGWGGEARSLSSSSFTVHFTYPPRRSPSVRQKSPAATKFPHGTPIVAQPNKMAATTIKTCPILVTGSIGHLCAVAR